MKRWPALAILALGLLPAAGCRGKSATAPGVARTPPALRVYRPRPTPPPPPLRPGQPTPRPPLPD